MRDTKQKSEQATPSRYVRRKALQRTAVITKGAFPHMCQQTTTDIYDQFIRIACAIAKHNAHFRARYPRTDPFYCKVERAISGAFWDMPVQLHAFLDAVERSCSWEQHLQFAKHLERAIREARRVAEKTVRNRKAPTTR